MSNAGVPNAGVPNACGGLAIEGLALDYPLAQGERQNVLDIPLLTVPPGARIGITGPSGSGKSSLIHAIAGLIRPSGGCVSFDGIRVSEFREAARDRWRRRQVGLVFQDFHLIDGLSALDNVLLPCLFDHLRVPADLARRARDLLERVGLADPHRRVERLSRGEMQRVAVARAMLFQPPLLLADEPTASLDTENGHRIADMLLDLGAEAAATVIIVSHDRTLLARLDRVYRLEGGRLVDINPGGLAA